MVESTTKHHQINLLLMNLDYNSNYTCNTLISANQTMLKINDGWETIPESILLDLIFSLLLFLPYHYIPKFIRSFGWDQQYSGFSWAKYFIKNNLFNLKYSTNGDDLEFMDNFIINSDRLKPVETYLKRLDDDGDDDSRDSRSTNRIMTTALLPKHFEPEKCPNLIERKLIDSKRNNRSSMMAADSEITDTTTATTTTMVTESSLCSKILQKSSTWRKIRNNIWTMGISDEQILQERGIDAYQYLLFQRYLIGLLAIMSVNAILLILPINIYSNSDCNGFACTSMNNLPHGSWLCWFHANLSVIIVLIALFLMNNFAQELHLPCQLSLDQNDVKETFSFDENQQQKILLLRPSLNRRQSNTPTNLPSVFALSKMSDRQESNRLDILEQLRTNIRQSYPFAKLMGIQLIMDNHHLDSLQQYYRRSWLALKWLQRSATDKDLNEFRINPYGRICPCISDSNVSPKEFYDNELTNFRRQINDELRKLTKLNSQSIRGIFVEFESEQIASSVYKRIKRRAQTSKSNRMVGNDSNLLDNIETDLTRYIHDRCHYPAPRPDDINWRNLGVETKRKWAWKCLCTIILFIIFFFLSTPTYVFKLLDLYALKQLHDQPILRPLSILFDYLNPLLMVILVSSMPIIVQQVLQLIPYQTISGLNYAIMTHLYSFMILTVIILPSAGFLTMNAMLDSIFGVNTTIINNVPEMDQSHLSSSSPSSSSTSFHWQCLFPVDNGAFFLIYIIHAAILGNLMELLRIVDAFVYAFYYLVFIRSPAEYKIARMMVVQEFPLGVFYSQFLLIFTMTIIFSFASPLIVPCGLVYMIGKHLVDRYNIYHVYLSPKINSQIHLTAMNFVHFGLVLMLLQLFTVMLIKMEYSLVSRFILFIFICVSIYSLIKCFCPNFMDRRRLNKRELGQQQSAIEISRQQQQQQQQTSTSLSSAPASAERNQNSKNEICICSYTWPVFVNLMRDEFFSSF